MKRFLFICMAIMFFVMQGRAQMPATIPYICDFENPSENAEWVISNEIVSTTNKWYIGQAVTSGNITGSSLYISNDAGVTNAYNYTTSSYVIASRNIEFNGAGEYALEFDVRLGGEGNIENTPYDYIKVFLVDSSVSYTSSNSSSWKSYTSAQGAVLKSLYGTNNYYCYSNQTNPTQVVHMTVILPSQGEAGVVKKLIFGWVNNNGGGDQPPACIDNISITEISCPRPTALAVPAATIATNTAQVTWTAGAFETNWNLQYKLSSDPWSNATEITNITSGYQITGLNPNSYYDVRVKSICTAGFDEGVWTDAVSFMTQCGTYTSFPWSYGFEDDWNTSNFVSPSNSNHPFCWININGGYDQNAYWQRNTGTDYARTGNGAATMNGAWSTDPTYINSDWLISPIFTFTGSEMISFYTKSSVSGFNEDISIYAYNVTTHGDITTGADTANFIRIMSPEQQTTSWLFHELTLSSLVGNYRIAFVRNSHSGGAYLCLDDVSIYEAPTCPNTYNLTSTLRSATEVDLNWMQNGNGSGWQIVYGDTSTFDTLNTTGSIIVSAGVTMPYTVTGLNPQTTYNFAVRQNCEGLFSNIVTTNTPAIAATLPYNTDFETSTENSQWAFINGTQTNKWYVGQGLDAYSNPVDTLGTSGSLYISNDSGVTNAYTGGSSATSRVYAYRDFEIPEGVGEIKLKFNWRAMGGNSETDFLRMYWIPINTNITAGENLPNDLDALAQIGNYTEGIGEHRLNQTTDWQTTEMSINTLQFPNLAGRTWRLLVHWGNESSTTIGIQPPAALDNLSLISVTCPRPSALSDSVITGTSTDIYWNESGSATDWIVEYKKSSDTSWTLVQTTSNPYTLSNLIPITNYQIRVRSLCSIGDTSAYSNTISFQTLCLALTVPTSLETFTTAVPTSCWKLMQGLLPSTGNAILSTVTSAWSCWSLNSKVTPNNAAVNINGDINYWLISPSVDLDDGTILAQIEFDVFYTAWNSSNAATIGGTNNRFAVVISTDDGLTWNAANATIWSNATGATRVLDSIPNVPTHIILPLFDSVTLIPYTGNIKIGFYGESIGYNVNNDIHIDNFEVRHYSTCQRPTAVFANSITSSGAVINFAENGDATTWEYVYGNATTITDPTTLAAVSTTTNPFQLTGLTPQTQYNIWVRSVCIDGNSDWSNLYSFVTEALPTTLPYTCGFEDATENLAWRSLSNEINNWAIGTAAGNGNTTTGTQANYISNDNGTSYAMTSGTIYSYTYRDIDFGTSVASYYLTFNWKCQGYPLYAGLRVYLRDPSEVIDPSGLPTLDNYLGEFYNGSTWQIGQIPIDSVSGVKRLIFVYFDLYFNSDPPAAIDNIKLVQATCPRPSDLAVSNLTTTTADISWTHPGADNYIISYRTNTTGSVYTDETAISSPYTIQGLTFGTSYIVTLRAICSGDTTIYSQSITFRTPCVNGAINQYPYTDDFTYGINCWLSLSSGTSTSGFWQSATSGSNPSATPHSPSNMLYFNSRSSSATGYLISSEFDITEYNQMAVDFWMVRDSRTVNDDYVEILVNTTQSLTGATSLGVIHRTLGIAPIETIEGWHEYSFNIPDSVTGSRYFIIKAKGARGNNMYVDDFSVISLFSCPAPQGVTASNITTSTADISWTGTDNATAWNVEYRAANDTSWTILTATTNPYTIQGLVGATSYQIRIQTNCSVDGEGLSIYGTSTFVTPCRDGAISLFPWRESFENGLACWTVSASGMASNSFWRILTTGTDPICTPHEGTNMVQFNSSSSPNIEYTWTTMASPALYFSTDMQLSFFMYRSPDFNSHVIEGVYAYVNSTPDTVGGTLLGHTSRYRSIAGWDSISYTIPSTITGTQYIVLKGYSEYGFNIYVDDITVDASISSCATPTELTVTNVTNTTANVNWTAGDQETEWQIRLGLIGTPIDITTTSYLLTGLIAGTNDTVYVRANCGGTYSQWVSQAFITTSGYQSPTVITAQPIGTLQTSTTLNASYIQGTNPILVKGFQWKQSSSSTWITVPVSAGTTPFIYALNGLTANTQYDFRAYVETSLDTTYGTTLQFTTLANISPNVTTTPVTNITQTTATFNGTTAQGTESIQARGFEYKLTSTATWTGAIDVTATGTTTILANATGLTASTQYDVRAYAQTASGRTYGNIESFITQGLSTPPTLTTNTVTGLTQTTATLNGNIVAGTETITAQGFDWKLLSASTWNSQNASGTNPSYTLNGLTANTAYQYRTFATTATNTYYGTTQNFTTLAIVPPTVTTMQESGVTQTTATLNGDIVAGTETITDQGFEWKLTSASTWNSQNASGTNPSYQLTGLTANTAYQYRTFATTATDTYYGTIQNFTTLTVNAPTVTTNIATAITQTDATLNGTIVAGNETITAQGFEWKLANASAWTTQPVSGTAIIYTLTGLTANTVYQYRAFATTATNIYYGATMDFTTDPIPVELGTVTTLEATNVVDHSATLHGNLVSVGNAVENIEVGFVYSTLANPVIGGTDVLIGEVTYVEGLTNYNKDIAGLVSETNYYYKAYITNSAGTAYGEEQPFLTSSLNDVTGDKFSVSIYPNPATNTTKLVVSGVDGETDITINDVQGKVIYKTTAKAVNGKVEQTIDVNSFAKGVYYVRIQNQTTSRTQKLIVIN